MFNMRKIIIKQIGSDDDVIESPEFNSILTKSKTVNKRHSSQLGGIEIDEVGEGFADRATSRSVIIVCSCRRGSA